MIEPDRNDHSLIGRLRWFAYVRRLAAFDQDAELCEEAAEEIGHLKDEIGWRNERLIHGNKVIKEFRAALERIESLSDGEMRDGDGARQIAREALAD